MLRHFRNGLWSPGDQKRYAGLIVRRLEVVPASFPRSRLPRASRAEIFIDDEMAFSGSWLRPVSVPAASLRWL